MNNRKNIASALIYQIIHVLYGFVVPRLIIGTFGSGMNGLVNSITQYLSFISLLEGGLGSVVLAELYVPIENNDKVKTKNILSACQNLFNFLGIVFAIYTIGFAFIYAYIFKEQYDFSFVISLVFVLSLTTLAQYLFSITLKLYLQANQKIYICNYVTSLTLIVNVIIAFIVIKLYPEIRFLKFLSSIAFFAQPLIYRRFLKKELKLFKKTKNIEYKLKNRWSGFAQNLAHFINMNTDIVLINIFCSFVDVSIYSVYMLGINALRTLISYLTNSYQSALGKYIAQKKIDILSVKMKQFCVVTWGISLSLYCTCLLLINSFTKLYTNNTSDANYYQPLFALIITFANLVYCLREPYRLLILAAGKFKETNFCSIMEAILNILISIILIRLLGLTGVAIGTLVAISYRFIYFVIFLKREVLELNIKEYSRYLISGILIIFLNIFIYFKVDFPIYSIMDFIIFGCLVTVVEVTLICLFFWGCSQTKKIIKSIFLK